MQNQVVLIIDSRKELSVKYKKLIEQNRIMHAVICNDLKEINNIINETEPDLIILSDSIGENMNNLCSKIRISTRSFRPVLVVLSKSSYINDKLDSLNAGADDFLSEPIDPSEFSARIFAHLRRHREELSSPITILPIVNTTFKVLRRTLKIEKDWALMYIDIDNFYSYQEIYGDIASHKMLQAFSAILKSTVDENDFLGQINEDNFAVITSKYKSEKIANFLNKTFDSISSKFYTESDIKRGYLILNGDDKAGKKIPLVSTSIGIISNEYRQYNDYKEAINSVKDVHKLAKSQPGSSCITYRPKLCENSFCKCNEQKKILIVENDAALAYLLSVTLEMQGYQTEAMSNYEEVIDKIVEYMPDLILIDAGSESSSRGFDVCREIKSHPDFQRIKLIVSTVIHDKEKTLDTGADLYLPKPYELVNLFSWVNKFFAY